MISRNLKRFAASNGTVALVVTGMILGSGFTARAQSEGAQSEGARSEGARSHNGIQGTWRLLLTVRDCRTGEVQRTFPALATFAKGGTLTLASAGQSPELLTTALGVWRQTGRDDYSAVSEAFIFSPAGDWIQTQRLTRAIEIDNDADEFTETVALEIFDKSRNLIVTGCGTSTGTRFKHGIENEGRG
jgi:hypothetical protein